MKRQPIALGECVTIPGIIVGEASAKNGSYVVQFEAKGKVMHEVFSADELKRGAGADQ
jgi:hypothetical protein